MAEDVILVDELAAGPERIIAVATLNLPSSLNALNLPLIDRLSELLLRWQHDPRVVCVVLQGAGGKAFCAGGDVRFLYDAARHSRQQGEAYSAVCADFFTREYALDYRIHTYPKPVLCLGHGIVMGGGLGLMIGASHRVVTDRTRVAMPEITIGLFPDVGATYFMPRLVGKTGLYIALTGTRMSGADCVYAGLADCRLNAEQLPGLLQELSGLPWSLIDRAHNDAVLSALLTQKSQNVAPEVSQLEEHLPYIEAVCAGGDLRSFTARMHAALPCDEWTMAGKKTFLGGSPSSAALIFAQEAKGRAISLADAFRFELSLATQCTAHPDFVEGVRALLIDKDQRPSWHPATIDDLSDASVAAYLAPLWSDEAHPLRSLT